MAKITPLSLDLPHQALNLRGQGVEPLLDARYIVKLLEQVEAKTNEIINRLNQLEE